MNNQFAYEMRRFQEEQAALAKIREANRKMERGHLDPSAEARRLEDELDKVPTKDKSKVERLPTLKPILPKPMFNPSRIKSSIPKQSEVVKQQIITKKRQNEQSANYIEELKTKETKRAVEMEQEHQIT